MKTLLAVPLVSDSPALEEQVRAAVAAGADLIELRVDCIADIDAVCRLLQQPRHVPFILTLRSPDEGGQWDGDDADRIALIEKLGLHLPGFVDVEFSAWRRSANLRQKIGLVCSPGLLHPSGRCHGTRAHAVSSELSDPTRRPKNWLILSRHHVRETPAALDELLDELSVAPAAVIKAAFLARDATDSLRVLEQLARRAGRRPTIALAMGEAGLVTRVLAARFGAFLTFAALYPGQESAPGQPTIAELRETYRWDDLTPQTRVFGLVGWPVAHSLGPKLHNAAMAAGRVDGVYVPLPVAPSAADFDRFMDFVVAHPELGISGLSVTLPHKENALRWLGQRGAFLTQRAHRCRAVNTLTRTAAGGWMGDNTDALGVLAALRSLPALSGRQLNGRRIDVLGAGGAARAVLAALSEFRCAVTLYNRTPARAAALAAEMRCQVRTWEQRVSADGDILINCTPIGLWPDVDASPMPPEALRRGRIVLDTLYRPAQTRLLSDAAAAGCHVISGMEMFLAQASAQFQQWHDLAPFEAILREISSHST